MKGKSVYTIFSLLLPTTLFSGAIGLSFAEKNNPKSGPGLATTPGPAKRSNPALRDEVSIERGKQLGLSPTPAPSVRGGLTCTLPKEERVTCFTCHAGSTLPGFLPAGLQESPSFLSAGKPRKLPEDSYRNVQKLGHLTPEEYGAVMRIIVASVGAGSCFTCHNPVDFSSDALGKKLRAREMIGMVQDINPKFFGRERVTCYTCLRGEMAPKIGPENWVPASHPTAK